MPRILTAADPTPAERIAAALAYRAFGWSVLALCPPDHQGMTAKHRDKCGSPGKCPWHRWKQYQDQLPTEAEINDWFQRNPQSNVGLALGPVSGVVRIDVDGQAGEAALAEASRGDLPDTLTFTGGKDYSRGLLFAIPPGVTVRTTVKPLLIGAELRLQAKGAQTVLPPSRHANGRVYRWAPGRGPWDVKPAPAPAWLVKAMAPPPQAASAVVNRCRRYLEAMPPSISGNNGHDACFAACLAVFRGFALDGEDAEELVNWFNSTRCDPPWSAEELAHKIEDARNSDRVGNGYLLNGKSHRRTAGESQAGGAPGTAGADLFGNFGVDIIANYYRERYRPVFRDGNAIVCADGELVPMVVAVSVPTSALLERLEMARDVPKDAEGRVKRQALPPFFAKWSKTAWGDLLAGLPDEDGAELGAVAPVRETFRRLVREALLTQITMGDVIGSHGANQIERRSLIEWCLKFAKPGPWRSIRSYRCWCKCATEPDGELTLHVAIRHEVFAQLGADRCLRSMGANTFGRRAQRYGVGASSRADRPGGQSAVVLSTDFVRELIAGCPAEADGADAAGRAQRDGDTRTRI